MHAFTTIFTMALAATALAAPATDSLEKRATRSGTVTLFTEKNYLGGSISTSFTFNEGETGRCVRASLPSNIDNQASSIRLSAQRGGWNCRLYDLPNCQGEASWFLDFDIPDLSNNPDNGGNFDNKLSSFECNPVW